MGALVKRFVDICLFQAKPQDLPDSRPLQGATALIFIVAQTLTDLPGHSFGQSMVIGVAQVLSLALFVWLVLRFKNLALRWRQTTTAIFGAAALIQVISWPIVSWLSEVQDNPDVVAPRLFAIAVGLWYFAITAVVFREAMETSIFRAIGLAVLCQICVFFAVIPFVEIPAVPTG